MRGNHKPSRTEWMNAKGFTTLELLIVVFVLLVVSAIALPRFSKMMRMARLKGTVTDFASLVQVQRLRAVDDDRYYSMHILAGNGSTQAFVDIYPQQNNGASGTQGTAYTCNANGCDPSVVVASEVTQQPVGAAPSTAALQAQVLPANSPVVLQDGSAAGTPVTFGPRGLPCTQVAVNGGTVCDSLGGPTAYWIFFQDRVTLNWGAVTVTPAGRVRRWTFTGGPAGAWVSF